MLIDARRTHRKPVMYALTDDFAPAAAAKAVVQGGVFAAPSAERCLRAYARLILRLRKGHLSVAERKKR